MKTYIFNAKCINVVDGDTIDCEIDAGFRMKTVQRLRLLGVNTPERGQDGYYEATEYVANMILGHDIRVQTYKTDVFGRYLATVYLLHGRDEDTGKEIYLNVNESLLSEGLAVPFEK